MSMLNNVIMLLYKVILFSPRCFEKVDKLITRSIFPSCFGADTLKQIFRDRTVTDAANFDFKFVLYVRA